MLILTYEVQFLKLSFVLSKRVRGWDTVKNDDGAMMMVVFAIAEISYLVVGLFDDLV